ncbi:VCBS repeat-containing protein [Streptomyces sp. NBC_00193]|uniref:FG-GAP repeat domain-containing protein n=1 Tax=unclassified Streptomyces TaxID=2593676 RepID=UPI00224E7924|nr:MULTISPECIES: VCBS repeat-containing protein [unclassified Streptomyces]MCX5127337.1 VCBS repeat-containing protein [Streptomyces sp. NBC_00347]MCX5295243.1 VCBS repeat-containing protein [Streptomyces sp. NBC_00193]
MSSRRRPSAERGRLVAACTGLAAMAGMLLSSPALAETVPPKPHTALPRADFTGDGLGEIMYRPFTGRLWVANPAKGYMAFEMDLEEDLLGTVSFKDYIPVGDQDGDGSPEILALTADGMLYMVNTYSDTSTMDWLTENSLVGAGWQIYNKVLSPGDLNGDARPDVLARTPSGDVYFYGSTGKKAAPFKPRVKIADGWQVYDQVVGVTDDDGDGVGDVVTRTPAGQLSFRSGIKGATPSFKPPVDLGRGWGAYNQLAGGDDMDGDGHGDLAARTADGSMYIYKGLGRGRFAPRTEATWRRDWQRADVIFGAGGNPAYGKSAVQAVAPDGKLFIYPTLGNGLLGPRRATPAPYLCTTGSRSGTKMTAFASDLALDTKPDLLAVCNDGRLTGGSKAQYQIGGQLVWTAYDTVAAPGDLTGDGKADLLARDPSGVLHLYRNSTGQISTGPHYSTSVKVGWGWNMYDRILGAGDHNNDGRADIIARTPSGDVYLYPGTGKASAPFGPPAKVGTGWQIYATLAAVADMDGDGKGDVLAADRSGNLYRYSSTGTGSGAGAFRPRALIGNGWGMYRELQ